MKYKYYAFISYSHKDVDWAKWLQHEFEYYKLPTALNNHSDIPKSFRPIFRDEDELAGGDLTPQISEALDKSKYLIVICSPNSAQSKYVNSEISEFISIGEVKGIDNKHRIFPFIVEGKPHANDIKEECFSKALLSLQSKNGESINVVGGDVNVTGRNHAFVKILAGTLKEQHVSFDELWNRFEIYKLKEEQRKKEERNQLLISQSRFLAEKSLQLSFEGNSYIARKIALYALPNSIGDENDRPLTGEAERALRYACRKDSLITPVLHSYIYSFISNKVEIWGHTIDLETGKDTEIAVTSDEEYLQKKIEYIRKKYGILLSMVYTSKRIAYFIPTGESEIFYCDLVNDIQRVFYRIDNVKRHKLHISSDEKYLIYASIEEIVIWNLQNDKEFFDKPKSNHCLYPQIDTERSIAFWFFKREVIAYDLLNNTYYYHFPSEYNVDDFHISLQKGVLAISNTHSKEITLWSYINKSSIGILSIDGDIQSYDLDDDLLSVVFKKDKVYILAIYNVDSLECIYRRKEQWRITNHKLCALTNWIAYIINGVMKVERIKSREYHVIRNIKTDTKSGYSVLDFVIKGSGMVVLSSEASLYYDDVKMDKTPIIFKGKYPAIRIVELCDGSSIILSESEMVYSNDSFRKIIDITSYSDCQPFAVNIDGSIMAFWTIGFNILEIYSIKTGKYLELELDKYQELSLINENNYSQDCLLYFIDINQLLILHRKGISIWSVKEDKDEIKCILNEIHIFEGENRLECVQYQRYNIPVKINNLLYFVDACRCIKAIDLDKYTITTINSDVGNLCDVVGFEISESKKYFLCWGAKNAINSPKPLCDTIVVLETNTFRIVDTFSYEQGFDVCHFTSDEKEIVIVGHNGDIISYPFPDLNELIIEQSKKFKDNPLTEEERGKYYIC